MTSNRGGRADPGAAVRRLQQLAVELGRIPTPNEVHRALAESGVAAGDVVDGLTSTVIENSSPAAPGARTVPITSISSHDAPLAPMDVDGVLPPANLPIESDLPDTTETSAAPAVSWWTGILDLGTANAPDTLTVDVVGSVVNDLATDWERSGRRLGEEAVGRVMERRHLDASQRAAVVGQLLERGIVPTVDDAELPDITRATRELEASSDQIGTYLRMVGSRRLLAAEEEVRLGRLVRRGQLADEELAQIPASRTRRSTRQLETEAARGREAHARFVEANLRLVVSLAHRRLVAAEGVELLDLIQFGNLGLMRAVDKFDPELGYKFSTYATWWVRQHMDRGVADTGRLVRLPVHVVEKLNKVRAATRRLGHSGHIATADAVGALTNLDRATVEYLWAMDRPLVRLDAPVGADSDATLGDVLPVGHMGPGPESLACTAEAHETIRNLLQQHCADSRSVEVIAMRFGLDTDDPMTLDEIGKLYGVTRERIRQIEKKALTALREALSPQEFRDLVEAVS